MRRPSTGARWPMGMSFRSAGTRCTSSSRPAYSPAVGPPQRLWRPLWRSCVPGATEPAAEHDGGRVVLRLDSDVVHEGAHHGDPPAALLLPRLAPASAIPHRDRRGTGLEGGANLDFGVTRAVRVPNCVRAGLRRGDRERVAVVLGRALPG